MFIMSYIYDYHPFNKFLQFKFNFFSLSKTSQKRVLPSSLNCQQSIVGFVNLKLLNTGN